MGFGGQRRLVVFGFGPIGAGLFGYEAFRTGDYAPPVVVDVQVPLVDALRRNGGHYGLNVAQAGGIDTHVIGPVAAANPLDAADRGRIVAASPGPTSPSPACPGRGSTTGAKRAPQRWSPRRWQHGPSPAPLVLYAAENAVHAAASLVEAVRAASSVDPRPRLDVRDTVIGKMSGLQADAEAIDQLGLAGSHRTTRPRCSLRRSRRSASRVAG